MARKRIPSFLQGVLWSVDINNLDLEGDKTYIINQVLSLGNRKMLEWLFETYSTETINKIFLNHPIKDYTPSRFNFLKNYVLNLTNKDLNPNRYVRNTPRNTR